MPDDDRRQASGDTGGDADLAADRGADIDPDPADDDPAAEATPASSQSAPGSREVVVPMRLYKTVTVFSTLLAIVCILGGFVLLDRGTQRATASPEDVSLPVVALGLVLIVGGSAVYAFSTRFRTEGMGKPKDDTDESTNNG